jgi:predicted phage terminase large subunit-like protein
MAPLAPELIAAGCPRARRFSPDGDKIIRLFAQTATIENGFVWPSARGPWLADYLAKFAAFPRGRHDDHVDSPAQALAWIKRRPAEPGIITYWRRLAEEGWR